MVAIHVLGDPILRTVATPVKDITPRYKEILAEVTTFFEDMPAYGLAAPQIGISERFIILSERGLEELSGPTMYINPEIYWFSEETSVMKEGCFSLPGVRIDVTRPIYIKFRYTDIEGVAHDVSAPSSLLSRVMQHEVDHLDGKLAIDYVSSFRRRLLQKRIHKAKV